MALRLQGKDRPALASRGADLLLPVSMAQVWAIEIVANGKLTRFERDAAETWFRHIGQHTHAAGGDVHVADPSQDRSLISPSAPSMRRRRKSASGLPIGRILRPVRSRIADADRAVLPARQLNTLGAALIRRSCRRPRSLRPTGAGWRGGHRRGVRAQAPDRTPQGCRSRFVRVAGRAVCSGNWARHRGPGAGASGQPFDRTRDLGQ